jgi:hypothetical protein
MNTYYNNPDEIASNLIKFFSSLEINLSKPNLKMLAYSIISMISSESVVTADLANSINSVNFSTNSSSNEKRFWRFFNNKNVDINNAYDTIIKHVLSNVSNIRHNELIVTFDHMYIKNNFVILMFTLKLDSQGIPIVFSLERTSSNCHSNIQKNSRKKLFSQKFIFDCIDKVIELLKPFNAKIIFLADRWFFNLSILKHIEEKDCFYAVRAKVNSSVKVLVYDKKENHNVYKKLSDFTPYAFKTAFFENLVFGDMEFKANLSIAPHKKDINDDEDEDYLFIITNLAPKLAIRKYKKRFGAIEMFFKSQKTNGFYLESTKTKNLNAMENLYGIACIAHLWLSILGIDYIKNYNHVKNKINIRFNTNNKRILSTFKLGLYLFKRLCHGLINLSIKFNFKLYM